ncbi:MAG: DUF2948 family protein [Stellaceae bacterium]
MAAEPGQDAAALKLRAEDAEDIAVLSAILQDALVAIGDMVWLPDEHRFILVVSRFRRGAEGGRLQRIHCGLHFDDVVAVWRQRFSPRDGDRILVLLAIRPEEEHVLRIDFAGGAGVRLEVGRILCHLEDLGEPWPTRQQPRHPVEGG